jgi:hypothetical protein
LTENGPNQLTRRETDGQFDEDEVDRDFAIPMGETVEICLHRFDLGESILGQSTQREPGFIQGFDGIRTVRLSSRASCHTRLFAGGQDQR